MPNWFSSLFQAFVLSKPASSNNLPFGVKPVTTWLQPTQTQRWWWPPNLLSSPHKDKSILQISFPLSNSNSNSNNSPTTNPQTLRCWTTTKCGVRSTGCCSASTWTFTLRPTSATRAATTRPGHLSLPCLSRRPVIPNTTFISSETHRTQCPLHHQVIKSKI